MAAPLVDIVIASWLGAAGSADQLELCCESIRGFTAEPHRVLVERSFDSAAVNRNRALARSTAPFVCFLDDDAWVTPGWCTGLLELVTRGDRVAMAGPKLKLEDGRIFCCGIEHRPPSSFLPTGYGDEDDGRFRAVREPFALPSTCLLVRRDALEAAGGFDPGYGSCQWEDLDYYLRLRRLGFRGLLNGAVTVYHRHLFRSSTYESNSEHFFRTWAGLLPALAAVGG